MPEPMKPKNPFKRDVVTDVWQPLKVDVESIHRDVFELCLKAFHDVMEGGLSNSVVLHGTAGCGKTHLLARLQRYLVSPATSGQTDNCVFVAVRLQTSGQMIWRYIQKRFATDILRDLPDGTNQLQRITAQRLAEKDPEGGDYWDWLENIRQTPKEGSPAWKNSLEAIYDEAGASYELQTVIDHLLAGRHRNLAKSWLKGDNLSESALNKLDIGSDDDEDTRAEQQAMETVLSLCRLAGPARPIIFCFDQVEALQKNHEDLDSLYCLAQAGAAIYNSTSNVLMISCIQSALLDLFKQASRQANWDRIARYVGVLNPLDEDQAREIIVQRLDTLPELAEKRRAVRDNPIWPLNFKDLEPLFEITMIPARKIINHCSRLFDAYLDEPVEVVPLSEFLAADFDKRKHLAARENDPSDTEGNLRHGLPFLANALDRVWQVESIDDTRSKVDFVLSQSNRTLSLSLCNQANMNSLGHRLKALRKMVEQAEINDLTMIRDFRRTISPNAKRTLEHLEYLQEHDFSMIKVGQGSMSALQALREMVSDAKAGDLSHAGETVEEQAVYTWFKDRPDHCLKKMLHDISRESAGIDDKIMEEILKHLSGKHIVNLKTLAGKINQTEEKIREVIDEYKEEVGLIEGQPPLLYEYHPASLLSNIEETE